MRSVTGISAAPRPHWVGDGFPVRSMFSYNEAGRGLSPFLLLDYAGPWRFEPTTDRRGVGQHPHRGFETVTIVYEGEVEHKDSTGAGGTIGPGDVQWMTAAGGIVHEEYHSTAFAKNGGNFEMVQLWVNLPARDKLAEPGYQTLVDASIPAVPLPEGAGKVRVIAGEFDGHRGPAKTFTPINVWDVRLGAGKRTSLSVDERHTLALVVLRGTVLVNGKDVVRDAQLVRFALDGGEITLEANNDATVLVLSGEPIDEPVVGYGPFVMNTQDEIVAAIDDFNQGRFTRAAAH